jgi:hypothetical protein
LDFGSKKGGKNMYYKCVECGHIFEYGEAAVYYEPDGLDTPPYRESRRCPVCGGDFAECVVKKCEYCEQEKEFVYCGLCEDCLIDEIDYENGLAYICETKNLAYFIFTYFYKMDYPKVTTAKFEEELRMIFLRKKVEDLALGKKELLEMVIDFIKNDSITRFADLLQERGEID